MCLIKPNGDNTVFSTNNLYFLIVFPLKFISDKIEKLQYFSASLDVRFDPGPGKPVPGGKPVLLSLPKTFRVESMGEVLLPCKVQK